ncbi:MAG: DMT family transporter [Thermoguttaceae bacterium]|nr:DMT family transporter [Thermoguttaceae bacterium]MDW8038469.1 DMT family transporter [Thermoguttaceae bacterium]
MSRWGSLLCFLAAIGYTATNMCLRQLAALGVDPMWATAMKETVAVVVLGPWFLLQVGRGRRFFPSMGWISLGAVSALIAQFAGNIFQQWSFGVVGLAIAVPAIFSVSLTGGALLAWLCLGETVSVRTMGALVLLIVAIGLLSSGAVQAGSFLPEASVEKMLLGIMAACVAGAAFAQLGLLLRMASARGIPPQAVVLLVTGVGAGLLGPLSLWRLGPALLVQTTPQQWLYMLAAGICNLLAFLAITTGLRWTKLVRANLLNAAQVAMGALAGIAVFGESWNWAVGTGVALTILGLTLMGSPKREGYSNPEGNFSPKAS